MNKKVKIIISIALVLILFVIISNLLTALMGNFKILPCRGSPLVPPFTPPTGPYDMMCYIGQSPAPVPWILTSSVILLGVIREYQPVYYALFWILLCLISAAISILIVWLLERKK